MQFFQHLSEHRAAKDPTDPHYWQWHVQGHWLSAYDPLQEASTEEPSPLTGFPSQQLGTRQHTCKYVCFQWYKNNIKTNVPNTAVFSGEYFQVPLGFMSFNCYLQN